MEFDHRFSGEDWAQTQSFDFLEIDSPDELAGSDPLGDFETRRIDGVVYSSFPGPDGEEQWFANDMSEDDGGFSDPGIFDARPDQVAVENILALTEAAEDVQRVASEDGITTFTATVAKSEIVELDSADLPMGLAMIAEEPDNLPEELDFTVVLDDDQLVSFSFDAVGPYLEDGEEAFIDATVSTTYSNLGEPQTIEVPPADALSDTMFPEGMFDVPEGLEDAIAVLEEVPEDVCMEVMDVNGDLPTPPPLDEIQQCFIDAGYPEAADAWAVMMEPMFEVDTETNIDTEINIDTEADLLDE